MDSPAMRYPNHRHSGGGGSFAAHLGTLREFAHELEVQLQSLASTRETVTTLAATPVRLGTFPEADLLHARHQSAVAQAQGLVEGINQAIKFAEDVTNTVASSYQQGDQAVAAAISIRGVEA